MFLFFLSHSDFFTFTVAPFILSRIFFFPFLSIQCNVRLSLWEHHMMWSDQQIWNSATHFLVLPVNLLPFIQSKMQCVWSLKVQLELEFCLVSSLQIKFSDMILSCLYVCFLPTTGCASHLLPFHLNHKAIQFPEKEKSENSRSSFKQTRCCSRCISRILKDPSKHLDEKLSCPLHMKYDFAKLEHIFRIQIVVNYIWPYDTGKYKILEKQ